MVKLKTLKDCIIRNPIGREHAFPKEKEFRVEAEEDLTLFLKREAIKWIKEIRKGGIDKTPSIKIVNGKLDCSEVTEAILSQETDIVISWIKHFFNITEKELK